MREWRGLLDNQILGIAFIGFFTAQILKVLIVWIGSRKLNLRRMIGSGGMPSSHASFAVSLALAVGFREGFGSTLFALAAAFSIVVMYDAAGVRRAAGKQAEVLNKILGDMLESGKWITNDQLKELIGHTPIEVVAGALVGALVAVLLA